MVDAILIKHTSMRAAPLRPSDVDALREHYPQLEEIAIEPPERDFRYHYDESYPWAEAIAVHERGYAAVLDAQQRHPNAALLYMGFVTIPLAVHLGSLFGQFARFEMIYQYDPRRERWDWPETAATPNLLAPLRQPRHDHSSTRDILIRVSCSHEVVPSKTQALGDQPHEIDVAVASPDPTVLRSFADLRAFAYRFREALDASATAFPEARVRHLAACVPVSAAFAMGLQISPTKHLPIQTWKFLNNRERCYARALSIGEYVPRPGVLLLGASPIDERAISAANEIQDLGDLLERHPNRVRILGRPAAGPRDLVTILAKFDPRVVHIACHGSEGLSGHELTLSTPAGFSTQIEAEQLVRLLRRAPKIECVILAACCSHALAERLADGVPAAIGFEGALDDADARAFGQGLWRSLVAGRSVQAAFDDAKLELDQSRRDQARIYPRPGVDLDHLIPIPR